MNSIFKIYVIDEDEYKRGIVEAIERESSVRKKVYSQPYNKECFFDEKEVIERCNELNNLYPEKKFFVVQLNKYKIFLN